MRLKELIEAEKRAAARADTAAKRLGAFFDASAKVFYISFSTRNSEKPEPNSATSHIGAAVQDVIAHSARMPRPADTKVWDLVNESRKEFSAKGAAVLPSGHLGPLPIFSTCFLVEFMGADPAMIESEAFAIGCRRVLYLAYENMTSDGVLADPLHPYSLFRIVRALQAIGRLLAAGEPSELAGRLFESVLPETVTPADCPIELAPCLGYESVSPGFEADILKRLEPATVDRLIRQLEKIALASASAELAWNVTKRRERADPTSLLFAVAALSAIDPRRHDVVIADALKLLLPLFSGGRLSAPKPFYVDEKGRAIFVATIECANVALRLALARFEWMTDDERDALLDATTDLEEHIEKSAQTVTAVGPSTDESRTGWCSDRAFTATRIDSWVTVEAYAFFRARQQMLRASKEARLLSEYSWTPASQCKPSFDRMAEPNQGDPAAPALIETVRNVVESSSEAASFLLYGPPGTGKTTLAKGLAAEKKWTLVTLSPSDFIMQGLDKIELQSRRIFQELENLDDCVILFDEMDTLLRNRETLSDTSAGMMIEFVVPALLPKLQDFRDHLIDRQVAAFFVTNFYERLDSAIARSGRLDHHLMILPYTKEAQLAAAAAVLAGRPKEALPATAEQEAEILAYLEEPPFNHTYRDIEIICEAFVNGGQKRETLLQDRTSVGISPTVYSVRRTRSFPELLAFMERYEGRPVKTDPSKAPPAPLAAANTFADLAGRTEYRDFFNGWAEKMKTYKEE